MNSTVFKPRLLRPSYFVWLIVPIGLYAASQVFGKPHMRWTYRYTDFSGYTADRYYTQCTYLGLDGAITIHPSNGACAFVRLFKAE